MTGIVITMYDEADIVARTIDNCKDYNPVIIVVHSDNGVVNKDLEYICGNSIYIPVSDLSKELSKYEIGSAAICRNYNIGFSRLYEFGDIYDFVIGMTGDTLITDFGKILNIADNDYLGYVLQAKGQYFYDRNDRPGIDNPSRYEGDGVDDIMPQFFMFNGKLAYAGKLFTMIENLNPFTSEEGLGNEIMRVADRSRIKRIHTNPNVYDYHEGIEFQTMGLGHTRRNL